LPQYDLSSLYALMCAAAPAPVAVWEQAMRELGLTEVCTGYGGTEVTASTAHTEVGDSIERITTRVGRLKPGGVSGLPEFGGSNIQYKVIDPFTGEDLPPGSIGELTVRGNTVTRGYYKKPAETAAAIDKDGWFRSGDLGRIDEHGYIEFLGRSTEMYKVSGENVSPKEVEDVINRHPAVAQAYVVGVPDNLTTETGAAFIQLKAGMTLTRRDVVQWCSERLAKFKIPRHVWFMEQSDWPMTGTGKIQKFKLRELAKQKLEQGSTAQ
jgi:fatty-acyl-CoA synthase